MDYNLPSKKSLCISLFLFLSLGLYAQYEPKASGDAYPDDLSFGLSETED